MGDARKQALKLGFDGSVRLEFHGATVSSDGGLPQAVKHWTLTTLQDKLIKIGAKVVHHARHVTYQMAEVAIPRQLFQAILQRIERLRLLTPAPA